MDLGWSVKHLVKDIDGGGGLIAKLIFVSLRVHIVHKKRTIPEFYTDIT